MDLQEYINYRCKFCAECEGDRRHQRMCETVSEIEGTWEAARKDAFDDVSDLIDEELCNGNIEGFKDYESFNEKLKQCHDKVEYI